MDQCRPTGIAQDRLDLCRVMTGDGPRFGCGIRISPVARRWPAWSVIATGSPRPKSPCTCVTPAGSSDLPRPSARRAPSSTMTVPLGFIAAIQRFRASCGSASGRNHVVRAPCATADSGRRTDPRNRHRTSARHRGARRHQLGLHAALGQARHGVAAHRLDLGGDRLDHRQMAGRRIGLGVRRIEPVDIRQQQQLVRAAGHGDLRGQAIVVAKADLVGGDGVVLVHDGHDAQAQQVCIVARLFR